jgi:formylglycine-generating enzyme required for sulfatase activity
MSNPSNDRREAKPFPGGAMSGAAPPEMQPPALPPDVRNRAVALLETFFLHDDKPQRRTVFGQAFGECERNPAREIQWDLSAADFASHSVDRLLAFGCASRGKHALSLLIETMATIRGRQTHPDYAELPPLLNALCAQPTRDEELSYLHRLAKEVEERARDYSPLSAFVTARQPRPTRGLLPRMPDSASVAALHLNPSRSQRELPDASSRQQDFDDILKAYPSVSRCVLLGEPGAGKSTTLGRLADELARKAIENAAAPMPVLIRLGKWLGEESLQRFVESEAPEIGWAYDALSRRPKKLVLLIDELNELLTQARAKKVAEIKGFLADSSRQGTDVILACRKDDYRDGLVLDLDTLTLERLTPLQIRTTLHTWAAGDEASLQTAEKFFWELAGDHRLADVLQRWKEGKEGPEAELAQEDFWSGYDPRMDRDLRWRISSDDYNLWGLHLCNPRNLLRLAGNPFMLFMLCAVWEKEEKLPENRGQLLNRFVLRLLLKEKLAELVEISAADSQASTIELKPDGKQLLEGLVRLAWEMQRARIDAGSLDNGDFGVLTAFPTDSAEQAIGSAQLLRKALDATLLQESREIRFRHQLLQEYFTAEALRERLATTTAAELWPPERWWERSGWEEAAVLLAGFFSDDCTPVIQWLRDAQPEMAAKCILESGAGPRDKASLLAELKQAWMPRLTNPDVEPQPEGRAAVGRALGRLERRGLMLDDRPGVGVKNGVPDIVWVRIEGGAFLYQENEMREIDTFFMARYPVTHAQYQAFLDDPDGHSKDRWWKGLTNPDRNPAKPRWDVPNHPRETVSWHEAMAFCAWLSEKLGYRVTLPAEWQWERAARGREGRVYPWGNEYVPGYANINETLGNAGPHDLRWTSPVGIYPIGATPAPEGVHDLSGNVWEWCLNEYEKPKRTQPGGTASRVLRGGSWHDDPDDVRAVVRSYDRPDIRSYDIGFRVVCSSPSAGR